MTMHVGCVAFDHARREKAFVVVLVRVAIPRRTCREYPRRALRDRRIRNGRQRMRFEFVDMVHRSVSLSGALPHSHTVGAPTYRRMYMLPRKQMLAHSRKPGGIASPGKAQCVTHPAIPATLQKTKLAIAHRSILVSPLSTIA